MRLGWKLASVAGGVAGTMITAAVVASSQTRRRAVAAAGAEEDRIDEALGTLRPDRESSVAADDGVNLFVEEVGPADAGKPALTVVFVHGYTLDRRSWHYQRRDLALSTSPRVRQVLYDHRSHGRSGRSPASACTIEHLGHDLSAVIRVVAPSGPLVLVGHSMGGMTIMALAEQEPELFAERVAGVALINTSAGEIGRSRLPRPFLSKNNPLLEAAARFARWQPGAVQGIRNLGADVIWWVTRALSFGDRPVDPAAVDLLDEMIGSTPVDVMTAFLPTLGSHDRYAALAGLQHCEVLVIGGDADKLTPYSHTEAIAALLPDATAVRLEGVGHVAMLEAPERITDELLALIGRCRQRRRSWKRMMGNA